MRLHAFSLPENFAQQQSLALGALRVAAWAAAAIMASILLGHLLTIEALMATHWPVIAFFSTILLLIAFSLSFLPAKIAMRWLPLGLVFPALTTFVIYQNGYLPTTFVPLVVVNAQLFYRGRFRLLLPYGFLVLWAIAEHLSAVQAAEPYVVRALLTGAFMVYPVHVLLEAPRWSNALRRRFFEVMLVSAIVFAALLLLQAAEVAPVVVPVLLLLVGLFAVSRWGGFKHAKVRYAFALAVLLMFAFVVMRNGLLPVMMIALFALLMFALLPAFDALMLSVGLLILGSLGWSNTAETDFLLMPFVLRHFAASMVLLWMLYYLFSQREKTAVALVQVWHFLPQAATWASSLLIGWIVLQWNSFSALTFSEFSAPQARLIVEALVLWVLLVWVFTRYLQNQRAVNQLVGDLTEARNALADKVERQRHLFSVISHEIRTPAATLNMLIKHPGAGLDQATDRARLAEVSDHLITVMDDLRYVLKPEQASNADESVVALPVFVKNILASLSVMADRKNLQVNADVSLPTYLQMNTKVVRQAVTNLVKNAILHAECQTIALHLSAQWGADGQCRVTITIEDDGRGISVEDQAHMFESFSRGASQADGTGLGLFIAREYADQLGGDLRYRAREGGGSLFDFIFVARKAEAPAAVDAGAAGAEGTSNYPALQGKRVLFAEDNAMIYEFTQRMLEKAGAQVDLAIDGEIAANLFAAQPEAYDLLLTDIMMPNCDGYELTARLRAAGFKGKIIGLTAAAIGDEQRRLLEAGADYVLTKPIRLPALQELMAR